MRRLPITLTLGLVASALLSTPGASRAAILSGTVTGGTAKTLGGTFVKLGAPLGNPFSPTNSVGMDNFESPNLFGFDETSGVVLTAPLAIDVGGTTLPAGTRLASHYVFFDPENQTPNTSLAGTVSFDADILGIVTSTSNLYASDFLSNPGVNYLHPSARGFEAGDLASITGPRQVSFNLSAGTPGDYIRVLTAMPPVAVPEPGSIALVGIGGIVLGLLRGRAMKKSRSGSPADRRPS